jgi:hypothetical protein
MAMQGSSPQMVQAMFACRFMFSSYEQFEKGKLTNFHIQ